MDTDEGSRRIGEVALISYDSPISLSNILFYNTLFDENASCHLALGQAYPDNVKGGTEMTEEQLEEAGANSSINHVDFMFGSKDMKITGIKADGEEVADLKREFCFLERKVGNGFESLVKKYQDNTATDDEIVFVEDTVNKARKIAKTRLKGDKHVTFLNRVKILY